jgi:hypothetical protein
MGGGLVDLNSVWSQLDMVNRQRYIAQLPTEVDAMSGVLGGMTMGAQLQITAMTAAQAAPNLAGMSSAVLGVGGLAFSGALTAISTIDLMGTSAQIINPPHYPFDRTADALIAEGTLKTSVGTLQYQDQWLRDGPDMLQQQELTLDTRFGQITETSVLRVHNVTAPERFMMRHYPVGSYGGPGEISGTRHIRSREAYRTVTQGRLTTVQPLSSIRKLPRNSRLGSLLGEHLPAWRPPRDFVKQAQSFGRWNSGVWRSKRISTLPITGNILPTFSLPTLRLNQLSSPKPLPRPKF